MKPYSAGQNLRATPLLVDRWGRSLEAPGAAGTELEFMYGASTDSAFTAGSDAVFIAGHPEKMFPFDGNTKVRAELFIPRLQVTVGAQLYRFRFYLGAPGAGAVWNQQSEDLGQHRVTVDQGNYPLCFLQYITPPKGVWWFWVGTNCPTGATVLGATTGPPFFRITAA